MSQTPTVSIIDRSEDLPPLVGNDFFHSATLFNMAALTDGLTPYMVVARNANGQVLSCLLATLRRRGSLFPPYLFTQGRIYGEGAYADDADRETLFALMLQAITRHLHKKLCLYIEFSDLSKKMFAYRHFKENGYVPIAWMQIHNSLHSRQPRQRLSKKTLRKLLMGSKAGIETRQAESREEVHQVWRLLKSYYRFRPQRFIPHEQIFQLLSKSNHGDIFITRYRGKVVGGSAVVYSHNNAYLWFEAAKEKSHPLLHPRTATTWQAISHSHAMGLAHIFFMNVGLPFKRNTYRERLLDFGGKPVSTYRWFHFTFQWMNKVLAWFYSE